MKEDVGLKMEIERRKNNLIMHGLKEGDDLEKVKAIVNDGLKLDAERHIEEVTRIGRFD